MIKTFKLFFTVLFEIHFRFFCFFYLINRKFEKLILLNLFTRQKVCDKKLGRILEVFSTQACNSSRADTYI